MKKRIFLMIAIISMLACLLAISASAAEWFGEVEIIDNDGDGESDIVIYDMLPQVIEKGNADGLPASEDALVKLNCTCEAGEHTFPAYYICTKKHGTDGKEFYELVFGDLNNAIKDYCGNTSGLGIANITALEVPNGYTVGDPHILNKSGSALKYFSFAKASTLTTLDESISGYNWLDSTPVVEINMGKYVTSIPSYFANNCKALTTLVIPKDSVITKIERYAFASCESLEGVYLPSTLVSLHGESGSFEGCKKLWLKNDPNETTKPAIYYFPASLTTLDGEIFKTCNNFNETVVLGAKLTTIDNGWAFQGTGIKNMICLGNMVTFDHALSGATVYFANSADKSESDVAIGKDWNNASITPVFCHAEGNTTHLAEKTVEIPAKCEVNASSVTYCFCGHEMATETKEGTALEHDWVAPTCTADGYCSLCGKAGEKTTGHDYVGVVTEPTCQNGGYTTYTCSVCKDTYTDNKTDAVDHKWNGASCEFNCGATREAYIGNVSYTTLADAIAKANAGDTIVLVADITSSEIIIIDKAITLDLNNSTVTSTAKKVFEVYADVTIKNGTIEGANRCVDTRKAVKLTLDTVALVADKYSSQYGNQQPLTIGGSENGTAVTMNNVTINAGTQGYAIISFVKTELTVNNSDVSGYIALYVKEGSENSTFSFVNSDLTSDITDNDVAGNATAAIKIEASNVAVNLDKDSTLTTNGAYAYAVSINDISSVVVSLPEAYKDALINSGYAVKDNGDGTITAECAHANATVTGYTYASGYNKIGVKVSVCECGETIEEKADALFEAIGYSVPDDGSGEIAVSFKVNGKAIAEFTSVTGKTVSYGVFAVLEERIGENSIFGDNGEIADGVICEELTGYGFTSFDLRITGLETDEYKATAIAMGAYAAISDGEATEYSCMQYGEPEQGASYEFVSYNDVKNNTSQAVNGGV